MAIGIGHVKKKKKSWSLYPTILYIFSWILVQTLSWNHIRDMNNISGVEFKSVPYAGPKQVTLLQKDPEATTALLCSKPPH